MSTRERARKRITNRSPPGRGARRARAGGGSSLFKVGAREIGHLLDDDAAHFGFPKWRSRVGQGRIADHPVFAARPGFGARRIETEADVAGVIALLRLNDERVLARHGLPDQMAA